MAAVARCTSGICHTSKFLAFDFFSSGFVPDLVVVDQDSRR